MHADQTMWAEPHVSGKTAIIRSAPFMGHPLTAPLRLSLRSHAQGRVKAQANKAVA